MKTIVRLIKKVIKKLPYFRNVFNERDNLRDELNILRNELNNLRNERDGIIKEPGDLESKQEMKTGENRYAKDWNEYSKQWQQSFGSQYTHLGDEWNDDETPERKRDNLYFTVYAERFLGPDKTVLEIGPGGGKWTVRIAPKVKKMIVMDVAGEMLKRTKARCDSMGINNIEYILANGKDFNPVTDGSIDLFFSYDVFVHISLEDTWPYAQEMSRVLIPGGKGICHQAINTTPESWNRIEQNNDWYRFGAHTLGQYYYHSPEALRRMYERCGMHVFEQHIDVWYCTSIFEKMAPAIVPKLELLLRRLISQEANDENQRENILTELRGLPEQLRQNLNHIITEAQKEDNFYKRVYFAEKIRNIWRGI